MWVRDTGVGIAPGDLPHIFERLYKGDQSRSGAGTGLSLAIVKHLIERHGGHVHAKSVINTGTTVTLVFPRSLVGAGAATLSHASQAEIPAGW